MKTSKLLGLLCALFFVIPAYAGFTDTSGLRWEIPPNSKITRAGDADAACKNFKIGNRPSRLATSADTTAWKRARGYAGLSEEQKKEFDATRASVGEDGDYADFAIITKDRYGYSNVALRRGNQISIEDAATTEMFKNTRAICVSDADAKGSSDPKNSSPSVKDGKGSPPALGPVLTRVETKPSETKKLAAEAVERNKKEAVERATKRKADQAVAAKAQASKDEQTKQRCLTTPSLRGSCGCMKYFPDVKADVCGK
jgi:hypothetical protein